MTVRELGAGDIAPPVQESVLFAHPADVGHADQSAAALPAVTVRLRCLVPRWRMYLIGREQASTIRYGFELEQQAEQVIRLSGFPRADAASRRELRR